MTLRRRLKKIKAASSADLEDLVEEFHTEQPDVKMPCTFETNYGMHTTPDFSDAITEPMQIPILPTGDGDITIRHEGRLFEGPPFYLRRLTESRMVTVSDAHGNTYLDKKTGKE